ncbi:zf-TFIIB domain-containing protein [Steroidobacter cummioxidans]|uniref:zf-TFIIB domain-containing protein n=1 Tax=Steroidobacter cummioxidans TaxID=1803913 RepID=UPI000E30EA6A|nr:zf-TFIIB domain-containing protein [Steroidobacter cummioxidans]
MKCPVCKTFELRPTMIEELLPAMGCEQCKGSLVGLLYYRHWAEHHKPSSDTSAPATVAELPADTTSALRCPKCERIMTKYRLTGTVANRLDVCSICDEAWLDGGEWQLLEQLQLSDKLPAVLSDTWQRKIRNESSERTRQEILRRDLGSEDAGKVETIRSWLKGHPAKSTILTYLYRN